MKEKLFFSLCFVWLSFTPHEARSQRTPEIFLGGETTWRYTDTLFFGPGTYPWTLRPRTGLKATSFDDAATSPRTAYYISDRLPGYMEYLPSGYNDPANSNKSYPLILFIPGCGEINNGIFYLFERPGYESDPTYPLWFDYTKGLGKIFGAINQGNFPALPTFCRDDGGYFSKVPVKTMGQPYNFSSGQKQGFIIMNLMYFGGLGLCSPGFKEPEISDIDSAISLATRIYRVDPQQIYLTGMSAGGKLPWLYPATSSTKHKLAATAPVAAFYHLDNSSQVQTVINNNTSIFSIVNAYDFNTNGLSLGDVIEFNEYSARFFENYTYYPPGKTSSDYFRKLNFIYNDSVSKQPFPWRAFVSNKQLNGNVATLTTLGPHGYTPLMHVTISDVDATFNGTYIITAVTETTFSFAKAAGDVPPTAVFPTGMAIGAFTSTPQLFGTFLEASNQPWKNNVIGQYLTKAEVDASRDAYGSLQVPGQYAAHNAWSKAYAARTSSNVVNERTGPVHIDPVAGDFTLYEWFLTQRNTTVLLPVNVSSFTAYRNDAGVALEWVTSTEINSEEFIVERSEDGSNYSKLTTIPAAGNSTRERKYTYQDLTVPNVKHVYYRLKQRDRDGKLQVIGVKKVFIGVTGLSARIYPTLATTGIVFEMQSIVNNYLNLRLVDMWGRVHLEQVIQPRQLRVNIDVSRLAAGTYSVQVFNSEYRFTTKCIKL